MTDAIYLFLFNIFRWFVLHTPDWIMRPIIHFLAWLIYLFDRRHAAYAKANLDLAFGDTMPEEEKKRILRQTYKNMLFNLADFVKNQGIDRESLLKKVRFEGEEHLQEAKAMGKPIIFIAAHYGNWELTSLAAAARLDNGVSIVGRPLESKVMDEILKKNREQFNIRIISKYGALRPLMQAIKEGRNIGLLVDQSVKPHEGIDIEFFGHKATHVPTAAILARKFDLPILPIFITTKDHRHYTLTFHPIINTPKTEDMDADIRQSVEAQAKVTEEVIRKKPDEWFWQHRRWKIYYPEIYKR